MGPDVHPRAFRLHFQRLVLTALIRSLETDGPGGRRGRRAAEEADRLRKVLASLGGPPATAVPAETVSARIAAYTYGPAAESRPHRFHLPHLPGAAAPGEPPSSAPRARRGLWVLGAAWICCAAALPAALLWRGVDSTVTAVADVALILVTLALFTASLRTGNAGAWTGDERRSGADRRASHAGPPHSARERRSGLDRRIDAPPTVSLS